MNIYKIVGLMGVLIAIVDGFVNIPYATPLMAIAGVVVGLSVVAEHHVRVIVSALALRALAASFGDIPSVGGHITAIIGNIGVVAAGAALLIIMRNMIDRMKP